MFKTYLLRRRCAVLIARLNLTDPTDITESVAAAAHHLDQPIRIRAAQLSTRTICGLAVTTEDGTTIYYPADASPLQADHIIAHELGHLLLNHQASPPAEGIDPGTVARLLPNLPPALIKQVLARSAYDTTNEIEAETLASVLLTRAPRITVRTAEPWPHVVDELRAAFYHTTAGPER